MLIVDLSSNQGSVDFPRLKKARIAGVWLKATEGATWNDPDFHTRAAAARKAGLRVGAYHFARPDLNAASVEARHFRDVVGKPGRRDLRPVLDFEQATSLIPTKLDQWARDFNKTCRAQFGLTPIFYSYPAYIRAMNPSKPIGDGLWLATYGRDDGKDHGLIEFDEHNKPYSLIPRPWKRVVAHQFSSKSTVAGVPGLVDLSTASRLRGVLAHPVIGLLL